MAGELLLDTGALVSLLDRSQTHHDACRRFFEKWTGPVVSTEAVLTEATQLLASIDGGVTASIDFFLEALHRELFLSQKVVKILHFAVP